MPGHMKCQGKWAVELVSVEFVCSWDSGGFSTAQLRGVSFSSYAPEALAASQQQLNSVELVSL
jgi:hypothetical protein